MPLPAAMSRLGGSSRALRLGATTPTPTITRLALSLLIAAATLRRWRNSCRVNWLETGQCFFVDFALDQFFDVAQVEPFVGADQ